MFLIVHSPPVVGGQIRGVVTSWEIDKLFKGNLVMQYRGPWKGKVIYVATHL
jgi:hypothetical protein